MSRSGLFYPAVAVTLAANTAAGMLVGLNVRHEEHVKGQKKGDQLTPLPLATAVCAGLLTAAEVVFVLPPAYALLCALAPPPP